MMPSLEEEIKAIEEEIRKTPYNKATQHHIGKLKAKLARLREEKESQKGGGTRLGIKKSGDATVAIIGFPSVGKSTLLNVLTNAESKIGDYYFTTTEAIPGIMEYEGCRIQILDLPGILSGASSGKGRGKEIISMARIVDLLLLMVECGEEEKINLILEELYNAGIRINQKQPNVVVKKRDRGGINVEFSRNIEMDEEMVKAIAREYFINADIVIREEMNEDRLIDAFSKNRVYIKAIGVANKADVYRYNKKKIGGVDIIPISAKTGYGIDLLKKKIFEKLELIRVYMKPEGKKVEDAPLILKKGATIGDVCRKIHRDFVKNFRYAQIWGSSATFPGQRVGKNHVVMDGDIITLVAR